MDKGKSKTDLRAAGKKRLEEYRQKRQQKGSSTKPSSTTALKALTESEQNVGENAVEEISSHSLLKEEAQRSSSQKDGEVESVVDHVRGDALEERHEVYVVFDTSPASSVTSSIQRLKVGGGHLTPETSEQSVESLREPGSSNGNLEDEDKEAVYTRLWENHGTEYSQRNEEWQESTFDGGASLNERGLDQGNCSSFWVDNESYRSESKEGPSTQRKLSGNSIGAADKFQSSEDSEVGPNLSNLFSDSELGEKLQSVQGMLQARDMELSDAITKLEGATRVISEQEEEAKAYVQQNERLKEELMKCYEDLGMLKSNVNMAEKKMIGLKNELHEVIDSFNSIPEELSSQTEVVTLSMNEMVTEVTSLAKAIVEQARRREIELQSANERAMAALLLESNTNEKLLTKFEREFRDSRNAAQDISWLNGASPPQSSLLDWATWLIDTLQNEHRKSEQDFQVRESMTMTATANIIEMQHLHEKIDSFYVELSNERNEKEAVAEDLRRRDLELQIVRNKLQEQAEDNLALESEVESARSMCRVESALTELEDVVGDFRFHGRPPSTSSPTEWISWLIQIFREVSQELKTSESASGVLSLQVEEAKNNYSSLYEELLSQKNENENLQTKQRAVHEMFGDERDSLKAEIQVLKDSSMEISRLEFEYSEAQKAVTGLQEALTFKDGELSQLHAERDALSLRSAQQDSKIQSLMEERERLSSEKVKAQRDLQEKIDSFYVELSNERNEKEAVAEDLRRRDLELQIVRNKLQEQAEDNLALESEVESARSMCRVESALTELEDVVGDFRFHGRPPSTSSPTEWISWLIQIFREVSQELKTSESASGVLSLQVEEAKNNYSSLYEELLSQKNENENLQTKQRAVHEMFGDERDSLKAEIQVLKDSSMEISRLEFEYSEAQKAVTGLQEALTFKDGELSQLHAERDALSLRSAQQDSKIQSLMEERERLSSEKVKAQRDLQEKIDSFYVELSNERNEKEAVAEDLRRRDLELQIVRNKLQEQAEDNLALESEVESARSMCRVESALMGLEDIVGDFRFHGRPPSTSSPAEWISWLIQIFREVSQELKTSESASGVLFLQVEEAKNNYSSLYEELLSQKNENENLQTKQRAVHEMFGDERDSLKAEIQVLKDSSMEISRLEFEYSEAQKAVTGLQEALTFKDGELSQLHAERDALSLRSAQQDSKIQSLMEERERLSSEKVKAQRDLQEKIDSFYVELSNERNEKEAVAEDLRRRDLELQIVRNKLQEQAEDNLALESEVESARSMCRVESALMGLEDIVGDFRFHGRPPSTSSPAEWISWLIQIFREVSQELKTSESASGVLFLQVEEAKNNYSSLYEELLSQKNENENLQTKQRAVHEMFGDERDSLKAEIQVLKDSSMEISRLEFEYSEAQKAVTGLQEALTFKDGELSQLHAERDALSLRSAQQDSKIQSLMEERERLSSEKVKAQRDLQEKIDSFYVELSNERNEKEAVAEDLRRRDLELQIVRNKLQEQAEKLLVLESEVESARSMCRVESALTELEDVVGDFRFHGRPPSTSTPAEWISWLIQIFREVSQELKTSESASGVLSLQVEEAKNNYSSLYEELLSQKNENENLQTKQRAVHEMFGEERDSLKAEIQVLKDSSMEISRLEFEYSEAQKAVTGLQEALTFKDGELSQLHAERDALSLRSAQQDSKIQSLMEERERLSSEKVKAQRDLQEKIDSFYVELSNERNEKEAVAEDLRRRDLELQIVRNKLQEQAEKLLVLESEVESARSMCRVESALTELEDVVGDFRFHGRPPSTSTPAEWISWLIQIFREVSQELKTSESASGVLSLQVEEARNNYSSLYEELLSQKNENENLQTKQRAVHEMFGEERDSLKAEIQVLKDSSMEISRLEFEYSEAQKAVTGLQEALTFKDGELSQLHAERDALSLRSAQQDSKIQSLMEERERLSSEKVKAQRDLQEKIDSFYVELSNERNEKEAVAEDLRRRDLELQIVRNKLQEQAEKLLVLESEVESARSMCRVESALTELEDVVGDFRFHGRPPSTSTPAEWISWLIQIFREVSQELKTSESASGVLSLQVEEARNNYSSLYEELLSQKNENENLQTKQRAVHEMFGEERDSLKAEIQVLKDSSMEISRLEFEYSEAQKAVTGLQEALTFKDGELSQLHAERDALSLRSAQQDSKIQSLMEERERLSSEKVKAQRDLQEKIDSFYVELSNERNEKEAVAEDLRRRDLELQIVRNKLQEQAEDNLALESEVESARSMCRVESALTELEDVVGDFRFHGRPPSTSSPTEWISWLIQIFREVSQELKTSESASGVLSLQVEEAKNNYSSLYEELLSQKNENENLQTKQRAVHEMFGDERDSLKAEIQVLKDSSMEISRLEFEYSEAQKAVTGLQEALTFKDGELSQLHAERDALSLRSAQQDSKIQSLMEERERLSSEKVKAQRDLQEKIDSFYVELSNERNEKEAVAEDLRRRDLELQIVRNKLQEQAEDNLALESEVESARSMCRVESALMGLEDIVGDFRFHGRPPSTSSPAEWISWLIQIFREVSQELKTSESASGVLFLQVEEAKNNYSSLYEELLSQKNENENLQTKQRAVHEMFGDERDSLKAEIQVLKDSSMEISRLEFEYSEAQKAVTGLQEALTFKDGELSQLHAERDALSLRSAQQDSKIQSLMEERERLSSEKVKAQRDLQEKIDSFYVELSNERNEKEAVAEDLRRRDLELQIVRNKLQEQAEDNLALESEVESARSMCRVESALMGLEDIVGDFRFHGRPPSTSSPAEWISWLIQIFREVSQELKTSESASGVLFLQVEEAKNNYSSLYEELLSQKNENENLQTKQRAVHEMFGDERDSLKAEIQVLKDSSMEISRLEFEYSEAQKAVTGLQEALTFKDGELSQLHAERDALSLRSAQQDSKIQSLMEERERLSSEKVKAQRDLQEKIDSFYVELSNERNEKEAVAEDLRRRDLELQIVRNKLQEQAEKLLVLESEVESARSMCRVESALTELEDVVGDFRFHGRPPSTSTPAEWISWLIQIFREVSQELKTSESASGVLSLQVEEAKNNYSSLYEELLSQKNENENLQTKQRAVHEMFGEERDSLKAEIQVLKDSSMEISRLEFEYSEAQKAVTGLQEALTFKDGELSQLHAERDALSLRSAQQDSKIQSLMEERERLSSEKVKAQRDLQEKIDSFYVELSNERNEKEAVAEDLRRRDLELQIVRNKLQEQAEKLLVLESEVESARSMCRVESALTELEDVVGDFRFHGRPPSTSTPAEWISWLIQIFREVSQELKTSESASGVLSLQVEEARNNYSSLYEELLSQKNENENLQTKQRAVHEMFGEERDSLKAEIQVLKDSSMEISRLEFEYSEAQKAVTGLQEALTFKDGELSQLHAERDALSLRSAQQDSKIQSLMEERERLSSEKVKAQRDLQEKIDSFYVELSNERNEKEAVAEDLRRRDLELQIVRNKLQEQAEKLLVLESEVESARSMCRVESALTELEDVVGDFRFHGRPPSTSTPAEWISWLIQIFREVSQELKTSESASGVLSLQVEEARNNYSSLYEELLSQKNENENLQTKQRAVHEMFGEERDSLKAEIQVLKDSSMEISRLEFEYSEAQKAVTGLQEALTFKDGELSQLHAERDALSLRSAQQDSKIQSLMEERERLSSEKVKAQRDLQEKIDSFYVELSNERNEKEAVAEDLRRRDLELQIVRNKLQEQAEDNLALESEVESARSMCRVESALMGLEDIVGDFRFHGRPPSTSSPAEWISWLIQIFREVSQELKTSESASGVLFLQVEEAKNNYSSLYEELLSQKNENENLQTKQRAVHEMFGDERDSLKAEIQVLKDSSMEISRLEFEYSEAQKAVTGLQEALTFKDGELSQLHAERDALSLRSAQQDSKIQSLMEERERLSSEVVDVKAECNFLQAEVAQAANEKNSLQSDINQLEQKLVAVREKLNLAINKGKGLVKQRDSLKKSLAEETAKVVAVVSSHAKDIQSKDSELLEMRAQAETMGIRVQELQAEVSSLFEKATASQERLEAERRGLESVFFGIEISKDLLPRDPIEKVKWLVSLLEGARSTTKFLEGELGSSRNALETLKAVLRNTEERLQSVTVESLRAQEDISMHVKKVEEVESRATFDRTQYKNEVDDLTRAVKEADLRQQAAWSRVKEFEKTVENQQSTINASEVAHSKAVTKLTFTRNKLNLLVQDSQELVRECESLHKSLQERDIELVELNHEVDKLKNIIHIEQSQRMDAGSKTSLQLTLLQEELARTNEKSSATVKDLREREVALQCLLKEKNSELEGVRTKIDILLKGDNVLWMEHNIVHQNKGDDVVADIDVQSMNGSLDFASAFTTLEERFNNLVAEAQLHRSSSDKKETQIQKLKKELHDVSTERTTLQAGVLAKTMEVERLRSEVNSKGVAVESTTSAESEIEELGTRSTWAGTGNPVTPHVRGPRRHSQADIAIDMVDTNNSNLLSDMNDKEHGFSALTNSRLVPKAARILADRLDGLWFVGGRILTRQPSARLGLAMYWIFIHVYMAMIFSRGIL